MAELSDIEEGCSSGALEQNGEQQLGRTKDDDDLENIRRRNSHSGHGDLVWSIGKAKGKGFLRQGHELQQQCQSSPVSTTIIAPALPSSSASSSSSSRTITPPGNVPPPHRVSSSETVQIVSPVATSVTTLSQTEGSAWSPASRPSRIYGTTSETASSATIAGHDHHGDNQQRRENRPYVLEGVPQAARQPFWWMDSSAVDLPRHDDDERDCLLNYGGRGGKDVTMQGVLHTVMHGVILALQSGISLGVLALFTWMTLWKDEEGGLSGMPGEMLRNMPSLTTTFVLILSFVTLLIHEIYILSPVVLLYLQAAILALTTVSATFMWMNCIQEDNAMLKCALISCGVLLWGTSGLAFLRAAVVWKAASWDEDGVRGQRRVDEGIHGGGYATYQGPGSE